MAEDQGSRVLGQILGLEETNVLLEIDIVLFKAKDEEEGKENP